jgi:3',5'-cyclic AMP phosphodiesterase CpdA
MRLLHASALLLVTFGVAAGEPVEVETSREGARTLTAPVSGSDFRFVIFGDRTAASAENAEVLEQAIDEINKLNPDFVMTVGDLVDGAVEDPTWAEQTRAFHASMERLEMPWFPAPGDHDVMRGDSPDGYQEDYEKQFGPLWYHFSHGDAGFIVLYSAIREAALQMPEQQIPWLESALEALAGQQQVFVFLHHPRWVEPPGGGAWEEIHALLAGSGNVRAVFAGHMHRLRFDAVRDGIEYHTVGATGGKFPRRPPGSGRIHHLSLVAVRPGSFSVAALPVGALLEPRDFTTESAPRPRRLSWINWPTFGTFVLGLGFGIAVFALLARRRRARE